jgi:hypothetical protein
MLKEHNIMKAKVIIIAIVLIVVSSCASSRTTNCDAYGDTNVIHNTDTDVTI